MSTLYKFLALFLVLSLLFSIAGCNQTPAEPTVPPVTESPEMIAYREARAAVDSADSLSLRVNATKTTTVGGESFVEQSEQTLEMTGLNTDSPSFHVENDLLYNDEYDTTYDEVFLDGTFYTAMDRDSRFRAAMTAEDAIDRCVPPVLLDAALYGSITQDGSTLTFTSPTAAEVWAMPEGAQFLEASGTATLNDEGVLQKMTYSLSYTYGPAEVTLEVESRVTIESVTVELPKKADQFVELTDIDALYMFESSYCKLLCAQNYSVYSMDSILVQAAGMLQNSSALVDSYGTGDDLQAKVEANVYIMDYSTNRSQESKQEILFRDGICTATLDGKKSTEVPDVTAEDVEEIGVIQKTQVYTGTEVWQDAAITDLGSVYIVELTYTEDYAQETKSNFCKSLFGDASFLDDIASDYTTKEVGGYFAVDKFTGLPTALGVKYEGCHTIEEQECVISYQADCYVDAPSITAYYSVTEEMLPEEEPETKAKPLFYHVTGADGQEMWLFGTIHIGDERTAYLPQEIYDALSSSDALALEYYSKEFDKQVEKDKKLSEAVSDSYYYSDGTTIVDVIGQELYDTAVLHLKASGNYNMNADYMKPYLWSQSIDNFHRRQSFIHTGDQGVESRLEALAEEQEIEIRSIESGLFQIQTITGLSDKLQIKMLEESIEYDATDSWDDTSELYELWCAGDEAALREKLSDEVDTSEMTEEELAEYEELKPLMDEYNTAISHDRNENMLKVAIKYLESGDTVFYAVGLAHLLDSENGLVEALRAAGYTVELVQYAN